MALSDKIHLHSNAYVAVTSISFGKNITLREELKNKFPNSSFNESGGNLPEHEFIKFLNNADAVIVGTEHVTDKILNQTPRLKIISKYGVGLDNIDEESLKRRNIALGWTGGVNQRSVSELTLCFMLGLCRNIFYSGYKLKQSQWEKDGGQQLTGKTIGIIGCGHIGSDLVRLLAPFKCNLLVNDIINKSEFCRNHGAIQTSLETLVNESDLISLHVPLTSVTKEMVNEDFLGQMKPTSCLINTSRGDVVDQAALKNALQQNTIAGAALDVFTEEPPTDEEFLSLPNLMATPHIGGNAREAVEAMGRSAIAHLVAYFMDHPAK
jgi:phosphoglycerate dehydrogenase-like enzyme